MKMKKNRLETVSTLEPRVLLAASNPSADSQQSAGNTDQNSSRNRLPAKDKALQQSGFVKQLKQLDYRTETTTQKNFGMKADGKVAVADAPNTNGNMKNTIGRLRNANASSKTLEADFSPQRNQKQANAIASTQAMKETVSSLENRLDNYNPGKKWFDNKNATYIRNSKDLEGARAQLGKNQQSVKSWVFQGTHKVDKPIEVGSNNHVFVDGNLNWAGQRQNIKRTQALSPAGFIEGGGVLNLKNSSNVLIRGSKRGLINGGPDRTNYITNLTDQQRRTQKSTANTHGVKIDGGGNNRVRDLTIRNGYQGITITNSDNNRLDGNFISSSSRRAIQTKLATGTKIKNNLMDHSGFDGIDSDAFSFKAEIDRNVSTGAKRLNFWNEVSSSDNRFFNNVAVRGSGPNLVSYSGGILEAGSAPFSRPSRNNRFFDNHVFYSGNQEWAQIALSPNKVIGNKDDNAKRGQLDYKSMIYADNFVWKQPGSTLKNDLGSRGDEVRFLT